MGRESEGPGVGGRNSFNDVMIIMMMMMMMMMMMEMHGGSFFLVLYFFNGGFSVLFQRWWCFAFYCFAIARPGLIPTFLPAF
jgi:hypothetical protein